MSTSVKLKIVFFDFVTHFGGAQRSTTILCQQLRQNSDVEVCDAYGSCKPYLNALEQVNVPVHVLLPNSKAIYIGNKDKPLKRLYNGLKQIPDFIRLQKSLVQKLEQINPDAIWTNSSKALFIMLTSFKLRRFPIAFYARGWYLKKQVSFLDRILIRNADWVLAVSNPTAEAMKSWGVKREKIRTVFTAVNFDSIAQQSQQKIETPIPGTDRCFKILVPGQLLPAKGQITAVLAAKRLKEKNIDFVMWLAGDVKVGDRTDYCDKIRRIISENFLQNDVHLLGFRNDIYSLTKLANVVVLPTHTEGFPRAVWESMFLQRPVISTSVGGIRDLIVDGYTGLLIDVNDDAALAQKLEHLIHEPDFAQTIAKNACETIHVKFCPEKQLALARAAFEEMARKAK